MVQVWDDENGGFMYVNIDNIDYVDSENVIHFCNGNTVKTDYSGAISISNASED